MLHWCISALLTVESDAWLLFVGLRHLVTDQTAAECVQTD